MGNNILPLKEVSIEKLFTDSESTYEIPIYQRNYAWEKDEITALVQDVYDAYKKNSENIYYIGTLVSYHKGDRVYEIIDGQQRLTTIRLLLGVLKELDVLEKNPKNQITYRARKKSDDTLKSIPDFNVDFRDNDIVKGFEFAKTAIKEIVPKKDELKEFSTYFNNNVHIIHYQVPKDIDLNHYFEVMNSRGQQLEQHEIVKAKLMKKLESQKERELFNRIWECCSEMSIYVQQNFNQVEIFGKNLCDFLLQKYEDLSDLSEATEQNSENKMFLSIEEIINSNTVGKDYVKIGDESEKKDSFQPLIDFSNFLLIVLKMTRMSEPDFLPVEFNLDDKELLAEFEKAELVNPRVFIFNLLKARFLLDNYVVHHSKEEDTLENNPWKLQQWTQGSDSKGHLKNLCENKDTQDMLIQLLSMFEVSFTARQRKNYLFYCLLYLMNSVDRDVEKYTSFVEGLADRYFRNVYLDNTKLNAVGTPLPNSFDDTILQGKEFNGSELLSLDTREFVGIYGDGEIKSEGIPLFVFNYLDYRIWKLYAVAIRGGKLKETSKERNEFFGILGCSDFGLNIFDQFYFSRTRRSLEHYYPQAMATGEDGKLNENQINCFGNYAMIGSAANSSGSNWSPKTKLDHYLDSSRKISQISVASLKFMVMMQKCRDENQWEFKEIVEHQKKMVEILIKDIEKMVF